METEKSKAAHQWFCDIYNAHHKALMDSAYFVLKNVQLAEDLVQDVFMTLLLNYQELQQHPNIAGWLVVSLSNKIGSEFQKARYRRETPLEYHREIPVRDEPFDFAGLLPEGLTEKEKKILIQYFEIGLGFDEIAALEHCTVRACRMRLYRARNHCQQLLLNGQILK